MGGNASQPVSRYNTCTLATHPLATFLGAVIREPWIYTMTQSDQSKIDENMGEDPQWRFIVAEEYASPMAPATETVRNTLRDIRSWLYYAVRRQESSKEESNTPELQSAPQGILDRIVPPPDWGILGVKAVGAALAQWQEQDADQAGVQFLIGAPNSHVADMVTHWGRMHNHAIIKPPHTNTDLRK